MSCWNCAMSRKDRFDPITPLISCCIMLSYVPLPVRSMNFREDFVSVDYWMFSMYTKCLAFLGISCIECFLLNIGRFIRVEYNGSRCKWFLYVTEHLIFNLGSAKSDESTSLHRRALVRRANSQLQRRGNDDAIQPQDLRRSRLRRLDQDRLERLLFQIWRGRV